MTFIDTNYFLRFFLEDNSRQLPVVKNLFSLGARGEAGLFTSTVVFFEVSWVLSSVYKMKRADISAFLGSLLALDFIYLEERDSLTKAVNLYIKTSFSLADCYDLLYAQAHKATQFATFDQKLLKKFKTS